MKEIKIVVDGEEIKFFEKKVRLDILMEKAGLDPLKDRLALVDTRRRKMVEFCCLADIVELFDGMCFVTCRELTKNN